ncbi:hypothetical protein OHD16_10525 [Sphingobacterium sp. ML3W]|uniref:hypothetical protein n=1 Tax=Sphingobacterium sp. ML3W TaxID=1538644 RepID=UPI00249C630E|nr:hypothetical protein [Sphingobacterium sp. ML3W]WFA80395.1 hypothetical protein OGI71_03670 [Sphingobacterium sp. ML3W]
MDTINSFYTTFEDADKRHEFDLRPMGATTFRGFNVGVSDGNGNRYGGEAIQTATTLEDYDSRFIEKILKITPVYRFLDFLDYHYNHYLNRQEVEEDTFIKHMRYVIYPSLERYKRNEYAGLMMEWITKKNAMLTQKQQEKEGASIPAIHVTVGNNSTFQFQHATTNSHQQITIKRNDIEQYMKLVEEIRAGFVEFKKHLSPTEASNLKMETEFLEFNLNKEKPDASIVKSIGKSISGILKSIPGNVVANWITNIDFTNLL